MAKDKIVFFIDQQKFETEDAMQTAAELLILAQEDPAETTLVLKQGNELKKYDDGETVNLKNGMHLVVFHDGPTPVSAFGPERFINELAALGYEPELITAPDNNKYAILRGYEVPLGRFAGRKIDLGMLATNDFPISVTSAMHVRATPQLFEKTDTVQNVRNIIDSRLGSEWRYWSINFGWKKGFSTRRLMSKVNAVFQNA